MKAELELVTSLFQWLWIHLNIEAQFLKKKKISVITDSGFQTVVLSPVLWNHPELVLLFDVGESNPPSKP